MTFQRLQELIAAYKEGRLGSEELEVLAGALQQKEFPEEWSVEINQLLKQSPVQHTVNPEQDKKIWQYIDTHRYPQQVASARFFSRKIIPWAAAAAIIACIAGYFLWQPKNKHSADVVSRQLMNTIEPATNGAILTLEDGTRMELDSMGNGVIANQRGTHLTLKDGSLIYNADKENGYVAYNTLQTPKGRQFNIQLPDGSRVWLNAASAIKYPVAFRQKERRVEVDGEAYFEVAPDKSKPFIVNIRNVAEVKVVGTHFNVNAYNDEPALATTLLSGAVEVRSLDPSQTEKPVVHILPGQQARVSQGNNDIELIFSADTSQVMSWKNGIFNFNEASLQQVMRQIARWYDLTIEYESEVPEMKFGGKMGRNLKLLDVLEFLEGARVRFKMEKERKLIVLPAG